MPDPTAPYITSIQVDTLLETALTSFAAACAANQAALGLTAPQNTEIQNAATAFVNAMNTMMTQRNLAKNATDNKDWVKKTTKAVVSKYAKIFNSNTAIPDNLLAQLQLPPHKPSKTTSAPAKPMNLLGKADGDGMVSLKWSRNGNIAGTVFLIETQLSPTAEWTQLGATTKAKFEFQWTVGEYVGIRVTAQRHNQSSAPSTPYVMWGNAASAPLLKVA